MSGQVQSGIIYGDQNFMLPCHMNYGRYFLETIMKFKDKVAMIHAGTGEKITYAEMAQQIVNTAASLTQQGFKRGEMVAISSENRIEYMITTNAVLCAGGVISFINPACSKDELVHYINISKPRVMFVSPEVYKTHSKILKQVRIVRKCIVYGEKSPEKVLQPFKDFATKFTDVKSYRPVDFYGRAETAFILYSSGTTGLPKGAKLTHVNLIVSSQQPKPCPRDIPMLTVAPFCNCMGQMTTLSALMKGKTVVFLPRFNEKLYLQAIEKYKVGLALVVPPILIILSKSTILQNFNVSSVETVHCGGAPLDPDTIELVKARFPGLKFLLQGYGMTEAAGPLAEEQESINKHGSSGKIIPGNIVKIVDIDTREILGPNQPGEVCVKGPTLFDGYIGRSSELDEDGFYKTGDIAYYDDEGYFYVVDRLKELIKYKAYQVAPSELEAILLQHPEVVDVGVVGAPDPLAGEIPTAFIVKKDGSNVTEKELIGYVASKVSPWKRIRGGVRFVKEIPKNPSGKILRRKLRDILSQVPSSKL